MGITAATLKTQTKVIVVMVHPGAVLTPFRNSVDAILAAFMPGQEYGNALVDVLWGKVAPTARLPLSFPASQQQFAFTKDQYPGSNIDTGAQTSYSEKLEIGYRYLDAHDLEPAFPFGHGLTYTSFNYTNLHADVKSVNFTLTNIGNRDGVEVPQLYLGFPTQAGEPPKQLKGFRNMKIGAGKSVHVTFPLVPRSFSTWSVDVHDWQVQKGLFQVMVGANSRDIRLHDTIEVVLQDSKEVYV